jgi:hypothetical protein
MITIIIPAIRDITPITGSAASILGPVLAGGGTLIIVVAITVVIITAATRAEGIMVGTMADSAGEAAGMGMPQATAVAGSVEVMAADSAAATEVGAVTAAVAVTIKRGQMGFPKSEGDREVFL